MMRLCPGKRSLQIRQTLGLTSRNERRSTRRSHCKSFLQPSKQLMRAAQVTQYFHNTKILWRGGGGSFFLTFGCLGGRQVGHVTSVALQICLETAFPWEARQHLYLQLCLLLCLCQEAFQTLLFHFQFSVSHTDNIGVVTPNTRLFHTPRRTSPHGRQSSNSHPSVAHTCEQCHQPSAAPLEESCTHQDDALPLPSRTLLQAPRSGVEDNVLSQQPTSHPAPRPPGVDH